jgi:hypothetical protein
MPAVPVVVEYVETCKLLAQLGYDPGAVERGSMGPRGYSDGLRDYGWKKSDHWERLEAAMRLDESGPPNVGNAIKYLWRAGLKSDPDKSALAKQIEDLEKSRWYIADEIERLRAQKENA